MRKKNSWIALLVFITLVVGITLGNMLAHRASMRNNSTFGALLSGIHGNKLNEIIKLIDTRYVDATQIDSMLEVAATELVENLDPHSIYVPASDLEAVNSQLESSFSGIGVQFNIQDDTIMIVSVIRGGPSEKIGLRAGDRIVQVNDTNFTGKSITNEKVIKKLRGAKDTKVKIAVKRLGTKELLKYAVTRGDIPVNSVDISYMIAPSIGFIKVNKFAENTYSEFLNAIASLKNQGAKKYIIDLRENNGGLMDQAIAMINEFLDKNQLIVYSEGKAYKRQEARADGKGSNKNAPIVVLIDEFSASASEIFAGAIQDNDRGVIVGRRSFGKGLVQQQFPLSDGSALRLTVARYYTPSGRSIQKPYENGKVSDYEDDILQRFLHGEFDNKDSIKHESKLKYKTLKGRVVYGGGGIMPDVFIPRDTTVYSPFLTTVLNYGYIVQFSFKYTDLHRTKLNSIKGWKNMNNYLNSQSLLTEFLSFVASKGVKAQPSDLRKSGKVIENHLKSYITRNVMGDEGFFPLFFTTDPTVMKALQIIDKK